MENSSPNPSFSICDIQIQKQMSRSFAKSFLQKIVLPKLRPHCSATCPNTWRAEHQRKMSFPLSKEISPPPNQESKEHFSLVLPREARQWRNDTSVRGSFKPPRAPRVRSGFAQRLIHHRRKKLPNPKGGKKPAPKAREWAKEPVASRRIGTGRAWRNGRICPCFISKNYLYVQTKIFSIRA